MAKRRGPVRPPGKKTAVVGDAGARVITIEDPALRYGLIALSKKKTRTELRFRTEMDMVQAILRSDQEDFRLQCLEVMKTVGLDVTDTSLRAEFDDETGCFRVTRAGGAAESRPEPVDMDDPDEDADDEETPDEGDEATVGDEAVEGDDAGEDSEAQP